MKKLYFIGFLILIFTINIFSQMKQEKEIDQFIKSEVEEQQIPGVALAILKEGKTVYAKGFGLANVEHKVPVKVETVFQSGSVGKQFTAAAIMLLVEDGKINLDDKIKKYFKDAPKTWDKIIVRHLLNHTSGMTDYPDNFNYRKDYTETNLYKIIKEIPLAFEPGERWSYSNLGYVTLGILVRKVSGEFYGDFLQKRIFKPLKMKTARVINEADIIPNRADGYYLAEGKLKNQEWVAPSLNTTGDGALYLTLDDLAKWDAALYGEKLFKKSSLREMWSPAKLNNGKTAPYGFGWELSKVTGSKTVEHGGAWQGFQSYITRYIDEKTTIIIFANLIQADVNAIVQGVAKLYNPKLAPIKAKVIEDKNPKATDFAKKVLQEITDGTIKKDLFDADSQKELYPSLGEIGTQLKGFGKVSKFELIGENVEEDFKQYQYRVTFEKITLKYLLVLNKQEKIVGLALRPE